MKNRQRDRQTEKQTERKEGNEVQLLGLKKGQKNFLVKSNLVKKESAYTQHQQAMGYLELSLKVTTSLKNTPKQTC